MGLMGDLSGSYGAGGSSNISDGSSWSQTDATSARAWSEQQATVAFERQKELMQMQQDFNSGEAALAREFNAAEAAKGRDWEKEMANSIYTRSVKNMIEAGINPILAANMGLSGANVGSGATAATSGATAGMGSAPLAQNFMDSASGSQTHSQGSSWNHSESGLATGLAALGNALAGALATVNSGMNLELNLEGLGGSSKKITEYVNMITADNIKGAINRFLDSPGTYTGTAGNQSKGYFEGSTKHIANKVGQ